jgi:hypothetical protein
MLTKTYSSKSSILKARERALMTNPAKCNSMLA